MSLDLYPDRLVDYVVQELSYEGTQGISSDHLWCIVGKKVVVDELYRRVIFSWLIKNDSVDIIQNGNVVPADGYHSKLFDRFISSSNGYLIKVNEEFQWISLTGYPKENNSIGASAFTLLVEIARSREEGIDSLTLTRKTGQDSRSLTSRIKAISHLIKKIQIIKNGRKLSLFILAKFFTQDKFQGIFNDEQDVTINIRDLRSRIVFALKNAKAGIREINDLRRELEMDKTPRLQRVFKSLYTYLSEAEYVEKVLVVSPTDPSKKFRSLKFLKDYDTSVDSGDNNIDELAELDENDDLIDDELKELDDEYQTSSLTNVENLKIIKPSEDSPSNTPLLNFFYPLQNQIQELVDTVDEKGIASTQLIKAIFGLGYTRLFNKFIESYTTGKELSHLNYYSITRHYDFQGRTKFYRYLSKRIFLKLSNKQADPNASTLPAFRRSNSSLSLLNKKAYTSLSSGVELLDHDTKIYWNGHTTDPNLKKLLLSQRKSSDNSRKRAWNEGLNKGGRPKKGDSDKSNKKKKTFDHIEEQIVQEIGDGAQNFPLVSTQLKSELHLRHVTASAEVTSSKPHDNIAIHDAKPVLTISDLQGTSFQAIERLKAILELLEEANGVREKDSSFIKDVRDRLGYIVDKKTLGKDITSLINQRKIYEEEFLVGRENAVTVNLLIKSDTSPELIASIKNTIKDKRTPRLVLKKLTEVSGVDLDFFDDGYKETFNKVPESKEPKGSKRVRNTSKQNSKAQELLEEPMLRKPRMKKTKGYLTEFEPSHEIVNDEISKVALKIASKKETLPEVLGLNRERLKKKAPRPKKQVMIETNLATSDNIQEGKRKSSTARKSRNFKTLTSSDTMILFKAVMICKSIKDNVIEWGKIADLFDNISVDILQRKWPRVRMLVGPNITKIARRNLKRILISGVRDGKVTVEEIENLKLDKLVRLWQDAEISGNIEDTGEKLFARIEDNCDSYQFVKTNETSYNPQSYSNSMIQREQILINTTFAYPEESDEENEQQRDQREEEEIIRKYIIAILAGKDDAEITKIPILEQFDSKLIDQKLLEMVSDKDVVMSTDSKLVLGDRIKAILEDATFDFSLLKINNFQKILKDIVDSNKGLLLNKLFDNSFMVPMIELIKENALNITRIDHYRKDVMIGYEARTLEREKLDCDIILSKGKESIKDAPDSLPSVPIAKPCSYVWVDIEGRINKAIWQQILRAVTLNVLSKPGLTFNDLYHLVSPLMSKTDLLLVTDWLVVAKVLRRGIFDGLWVQPEWYLAL